MRRLALGASGTTYTAPADGYFLLRAATLGNVGATVDMFIQFPYLDLKLDSSTTLKTTSGIEQFSCALRAPKGSYLTLLYSVTELLSYEFCFIYAKGEV